MTSTGADSYFAGQETVPLTYNEAERCYEFEFFGYWKLISGQVMHIHYENSQYFGEKYQVSRPIDPNDYWWFEPGRKETGIFS